VTKGHFAWLMQAKDRPTTPPETVVDTLKLLRSAFAGGGTYTTSGNSYTENVEFFPDPGMIGRSIPFTCRVSGDRWYHAGTVPATGAGSRAQKIEEVWRRIE
jgi:hypothetical protein